MGDIEGRFIRILVIGWLWRKREKGEVKVDFQILRLGKWENCSVIDRVGVNQQEELVWLREGDGFGFSWV